MVTAISMTIYYLYISRYNTCNVQSMIIGFRLVSIGGIEHLASPQRLGGLIAGHMQYTTVLLTCKVLNYKRPILKHAETLSWLRLVKNCRVIIATIPTYLKFTAL